ncbi:hypothetical protein PILCRDRAFT_83525 [Piloderma croceum F 1598]|uniref:Uncharacterized protein n=1 Tax=Piloderma croceum (strain F 1598) TaxID=765440 RepID=A0A0C3CRN4_PILCF|nr:hypothetical protein PILCRDRAFT_83525 [Piloderma croceum F 1598]
MTVGVFDISDDTEELDIDDDDGIILEDGNGAVPEDGDGIVANDGDRAVANDGDGAETNDGDGTEVKDGNGAVLKDGNGDDGTITLSVTGASLDTVDGCRMDRMDGNGILLIVREGDEEIVLLEGIDGDEGIESDDEIVLSVIGGSLDTDDTTDAVGLKKDVSNDTSPGSPKVTDLIDGEGSNIDESYEASVSEAHSDSRTDGLEIDEGVRRMVGVIDVSVTLDGVVVNLEEGSRGGSLRIPLSLGEESLGHVEGERRDCVDNSSVSGKSLDTARLRDDMGALRADTGALRTDTGGLRTDIEGLRTDTGGLRTDTGGLRTDTGGLRTDTGGLRTDAGGLRTDTGGL